MNKQDSKNIANVYFELLNRQKFAAEELDYSILDKHIPMLQTLATVGNSGVSVFDVFKKEHVFYSPNFGVLLGYDANLIKEKGPEYWDEKIHPDDYVSLMQNGISIFKLYIQLSTEEKEKYKLINEYRILNADNKYVRVIEQHQTLALDTFGNLWLSLSIIDISPNQDSDQELKCQLVNFKTGDIYPFGNTKNNHESIGVALSKRELQILKMVKAGLLSKEISDNLNISFHTVNTHRQRILEKLGANNSMEAVVYASKLGLL
ncbi:MAG: LuxR C-terminal-related transcriptional regulator [Bacteroidales bacterium]|nr:LuxR C-terminal-related transcriptional regulator [Bacteroidales bacterium]MDD4439527.1 LuxR C-terminal-related transcriptional regulator [Tissierellia bacterium]